MVSYTVAAAVFVISSSYLMQFVVEPPGSSTSDLDHLDLTSKASSALDILLGTPGYPFTWDATSVQIDAVQRLGLVENGATIRIDPEKFNAMARGRSATTSTGNGAVDYAEAKSALGLDGYEFHLRAYPVISPSEAGGFGVNGFGDYNVAYVGKTENGALTAEALDEAAALAALKVGFTNALRDASSTGDVYKGDSNYVRTHLMPNLGQTIQESVISNGAGTQYDFYRVAAAAYDHLPLAANATPTDGRPTMAMALSSDGSTLGYSKNREIRAIVGSATLGGTGADLQWWEHVDTDRGNLSYDCGDYGYVEVSPDNGATWFKLTDTGSEARSQDCDSGIPPAIHAPNMTMRSVDIDSVCAACTSASSVLVAFHWIADNDNSIGYGWMVDDVLVVSENANKDILLRKTFESTEYDLVIIGSGVDHATFTPAEVKDGIRDYVDKQNGRILVLGGSATQGSVQWLDRLFDAGIGGGAGGVTTPDTTHPLLTAPNKLDYTSFGAGTPWAFSSSDDVGLFNMIMGADATHHHLTLSKQGAWGNGLSGEGAVVLTSFQPHQFKEDQAERFFANSIAYGKFHHLYLELGPTVPDGQAVASVARSATMNKNRTGEANYTEMAFILYTWPGTSSAATYGATSVTASPSGNVAASADDKKVTLTWTEPASNGTGNETVYAIYRGNAPGQTNWLASVPAISDEPASIVHSYTYVDNTAVNGTTYWYNISLNTTVGAGATSSYVSATPSGLPNAPTGVSATGALSKITVSWSPPGWTGPSTIYGYVVYVNDSEDPPNYVQLSEVGSTTTFVHTPGDNVERSYKVAAINSRGLGLQSDASDPANAISPAGAPSSLTVSNATAPNLALGWATPGELGSGTLLGYKIHRKTSGDWYQLAYLNSAANVSFEDKNVSVNTTYSYMVQAVTSVGDGANTSLAGGTTAGVPWPTSGLTPDADLLPTVVTMHWTAPYSDGGSPILGYDVYRGTTQGFETFLTQTVTTSFVDTPVSMGGTYYYKVRAYNAAGAGEFTPSVMMLAAT